MMSVTGPSRGTARCSTSGPSRSLGGMSSAVRVRSLCSSAMLSPPPPLTSLLLLLAHNPRDRGSRSAAMEPARHNTETGSFCRSLRRSIEVLWEFRDPCDATEPHSSVATRLSSAPPGLSMSFTPWLAACRQIKLRLQCRSVSLFGLQTAKKGSVQCKTRSSMLSWPNRGVDSPLRHRCNFL